MSKFKLQFSHISSLVFRTPVCAGVLTLLEFLVYSFLFLVFSVEESLQNAVNPLD
jgi:hypothetical protein